MIMLLRAVLFLGGAFYLFLGATFLLYPSGQGGDFGLFALSNQGLSTIRGDLTAFFGVAGGSMVLGAWKQNGAAVLVAAALMGITLAGRAVSLGLDGFYEGWQMPMGVEALTVIIALFASRVFPNTAQRAGTLS